MSRCWRRCRAAERDRHSHHPDTYAGSAPCSGDRGAMRTARSPAGQTPHGGRGGPAGSPLHGDHLRHAGRRRQRPVYAQHLRPSTSRIQHRGRAGHQGPGRRRPLPGPSRSYRIRAWRHRRRRRPRLPRGPGGALQPAARGRLTHRSDRPRAGTRRGEPVLRPGSPPLRTATRSLLHRSLFPRGV
jgi:hypothetical protein